MSRLARSDLQIRGHLGVDRVAHGRVDVLDEQRHGEKEVADIGGDRYPPPRL